MDDDFDQDIILGAEAMVVLPADEVLQDHPDRDEGRERPAWARHALGSLDGAAERAGLDAEDMDIREVLDRIFLVRPE
jgi:hypothetical protein